MVKVFNRWGQEVYVGYFGDDPWDGTFNDKLLPAGSYIYIVEVSEIKKEFVGIVTLIR
jgi:gliding motility-associated-like protein